MAKRRLRISLANKCQLLFGAAVILILAAALTVVSARMQSLVEQIPHERARDFADAWLNDQIQLRAALRHTDSAVHQLAPDDDLTVSLIGRKDFDRLIEHDPFLQQAVERFENRARSHGWFASAKDPHGKTFYRYARAIRKSDLARIRSHADPSTQPSAAAATLANPLEMVLLIHLRDRAAASQQIINRIYIVAAGILAGLLAIGVFWFITTRLILSPVRLLRDVATKVSQGDLNIRSDINTGDEFEELSNVFNGMLHRQKEKQDQLKSINKSLDLKLDELAQSNVSLYEANKVKGEFLANVSHELRTPLNSMIGFAELLQETLADRTSPIDEKRNRYIGHIINSSRRLLDLINDLLDLTKIEAGRVDLNITSISAADMCEGLVNLMRPQAEKQNITLRLKMEANLPIVHTDAGKVQQILFNFLSNAVKYTPPSGLITLSAVPLPPVKANAQPRVRLAVSDTGPGIAPEDHERVFDKFTQLDAGVTREHVGTGLGLTISRELAHMLQGRIELDSDLGSGATFSLTLPVSLEQRSVALMPAARAAVR